jgi:hypothetical protein
MVARSVLVIDELGIEVYVSEWRDFPFTSGNRIVHGGVTIAGELRKWEGFPEGEPAKSTPW